MGILVHVAIKLYICQMIFQFLLITYRGILYHYSAYFVIFELLSSCSR